MKENKVCDFCGIETNKYNVDFGEIKCNWCKKNWIKV